MEDIFLFSTSTALEELELFNPLPVIGEDGFLEEYDVYSCIEDPDVKSSLVAAPSSLLAGDLLQEFDIEGLYLVIFLATFFCKPLEYISLDFGSF